MISGIQTSGLHLASSQRILVVDKNENNRLGLRLFLRDIAKSPELIETSDALAAMQALTTRPYFNLVFISPNTIKSSASLYFLWLLRSLDKPPTIYLIAKNAEANTYINHFIDAQNVLMLDDPADKIKQQLKQMIRQTRSYVKNFR